MNLKGKSYLPNATGTDKCKFSNVEDVYCDIAVGNDEDDANRYI